MYDESYNKSLAYSGAITNPFSVEEQDLLKAVKQQQTADEAAADRMGVPVERLLQVRDYAEMLHRKHPTMTKARVQRKTAEHFKIKLT